jgi:hypothetical protein
MRFIELPPDVQEKIKNIIEKDELISIEERKIYNTYWYMQLKVKSRDKDKAIEESIQNAKLNDAIFKLIFSLNKNKSLLIDGKTSNYFNLFNEGEKQNFDYGPKLGHRHSLYRINEQIRTVVTQINESIRF